MLFPAMASSSGMKTVMDGIQPLLFQMRVNLRGGYVRMSQHLLDDSEVRAVLQQMRGK